LNKVFAWPPLKKILPDVFAFVIGLAIAWELNWSSTDLIWSLWLCSLVVGYLTILSTIGAIVYIGIKSASYEETPKKLRLPAILAGFALAAFLLGFFSLHFCGFHAAHASFLSSFFPIDELPEDAFNDAFMNPFLLWKVVFQHLLMLYGIFLIPAIITERKYIFLSISEALAFVRSGPENSQLKDFNQSGKGLGKSARDPFFRPYINVIRMHLLIFFFVFCHFLKIDSFFVYAVVYFVYFFPWKEFRAASASQ